MGRTANLSALGLYEWDNSIFDLMVIPSALDKNTLIQNLLAETAELEILYPNPVVLKNLVGVWSRKQIDVWNKLYSTTQYDYNPIENYNRYETGSEDGSSNSTNSGSDSHTATETHSGTDTRRIERETGGADTNTGFSTTEHSVAGFDSNGTLVKQTEDETNSNLNMEYGGTEDTDDTLTHGEKIHKTDTLAHGKRTTESREGSHELHAHGNIGVTTTQKLIKEERSIDLFNVYDIIIEDFKMRFCIMVY